MRSTLLLLLAVGSSLTRGAAPADLCADTATWAVFTLDHPRWPERREVAISKTGLVLTLVWLGPDRARLTPERLSTSDVHALFDLVENRVRFRQLRSLCPPKRPRYLLAGRFGYALPEPTEAHHAVCEDVATSVAPLLARLEALLARSDKAWRERDPHDHPPGVVIETTEPLDFLARVMWALHGEDTPADGPGAPQSGSPNQP
jgi:hypothetical protein